MSRGDLVPRRRLRLAPILVVALMALAGCGSNSSSSSSGGGGATTAAGSSGGATSAAGATSSGGGSGSVDISSCGPKPGVKATGSPINLGTINTKQPGTDFTDQASMAQAYFNCVNDNGGVNGHPINYFVQTDQTQPAQIAAAANKLLQSDHVLGIVGTSDII
jgi:branched-chain amino acid transport system substrate-binding protein